MLLIATHHQSYKLFIKIEMFTEISGLSYIDTMSNTIAKVKTYYHVYIATDL